MKRSFWLALPVALLLVALTGPLAAQEESTAAVATGRLNVRDTPDFLLGRRPDDRSPAAKPTW